MWLSNIFVIYRKELLDAVRDRRTIVSAIVIPLVLFPALTFGFGAAMATSVKKVQKENFKIMIFGATNAPTLVEKIKASPAFSVEDGAADYKDRITNKKLRAALEIPAQFQESLQTGGTNNPRLSIYHYSGELRSQFAVKALQQVIREYSDKVVAARLEDKGLPKNVLKPFETIETNVAPPEKVGGSVLGGLIPYMIIFLSFAGAMAPAIDLTAGEKERGTIETILASPVSRVHLVFGKFLMVLTASMVTTLISLSSFAVTFSAPSMMVGPGGAPFHVNLNALLGVLFLILPLAVMFSAGLMTIGLFAKTYKEAQTYISPLMMLVLMPAMAAMLPGMDLKPWLTIVPIINVSLISKELLTGSYQILQVLAVFGSSCFYAAIALAAAVAIFKRESVLFRT